jgi:drug/metabolite transporter (DMT)-like permease
MSGKTVNSAILLLVVSDVFIKLLEPGAPIFQFAFVRCMLTLVLLLPLARKIDRTNLFAGIKVHAIRAHVHLVGLLCMIVALSNLPLATANAVFYAAPILVMVFSVFIFREVLSPLNVFAVFSGFAGIIVILRPVEFNWAAVAALGSAITLAINAVMVRKLPKTQTTVHKLFLNYLLVIPASGLLALWEWQQGASWDPAILFTAAASAFFILGYNIAVLLAYHQVDANQVTSAEYTGLIWAVLIGWIGFNEVPDLWFAVGSVMIIVPLIMVGMRSRQRSHRVLRAQPLNG